MGSDNNCVQASITPPALCECCLSNKNLKNIFKPVIFEETLEIYSEMLFFCFSIAVTGKPYATENVYICESCIDTLRNVHDFRSQVEYAQSKIEKYCTDRQSQVSSRSLQNSDLGEIKCDEFPVENAEPSEYSLTEGENGDKFPNVNVHLKDLNIPHSKRVATYRPKQTETVSAVWNNDPITTSKTPIKRGKRDSQTSSPSNEDEFSKVKQKDTKSLYKIDKDALSCTLCNKTFESNRLLVIHMAIHFPNFICDVCGKCYVTKHNLSSHRSNVHSIRIPCKICTKLIKKPMMSQHLKCHIVGNKDPKRCIHCNEMFPSFSIRARHMKNVHNINPYNYQCKLCPKKYITTSARSSHVSKYHHHKVNHTCSFCSQGFFDLSALRCHMATHTGKKYFECNICHKGYSRRYKLVEHLKIHGSDHVTVEMIVENDLPKVYTQRPCENS